MSFSLQAVLFDLDGVLVHSPLDLDAIKRELFGDASVFIIEGLEAFPEKEKLEKQEILHMRELEAAANASLDPGVDELFKWINDRGLEKGIITRNTCDVVNLIKKKFQIDFGAVVAREDAPPKPDPESVYTACRMLNVNPENCVMVGDFAFDIEAGKRAGCRTVFIETEKFRHLRPGEDARITSLIELIKVLEKWTAES